MKLDRYRHCAALLTAALASGCAGNGDGLNSNGQPIGSGGSSSSGPITADFESIQEHVFTPICSVCHIGAGAPEGLQLDAAHSYNLLVGVPSAEMPSLLRVKPGDPTDSYIVHKIKGPPGIVGGQMPLNEKPLDPATMQAIEQWIMNGAPNAPAAAAAAAQVFAVQTTAPVNGATVKAPLARILVTFTQDVDASLVNDTTVTLERMAGDTSMAAAAPMTAVGALAQMNPAVLMITPTKALDSGVYRVTVRGTGGGALANMNAATLGSDTSFQFTVEPAQ
jgi:hypothetical protein